MLITHPINLHKYALTAFGCLLIASAVAHAAPGENALSVAHQEAEYREDHEQDALEVMSLINRSETLRAELPGFVDETSEAILVRKGALPSTYALRIAHALENANEIRNGLFKQALSHRSALYRTDAGLEDSDRIMQIVIAMSAAVTLYENNTTMRAAFKGRSLLRKKLNEGYPEFGIPAKYYDSSVMRAANPEYRKAMSDAVRFMADNHEAVERILNQSSASVRQLYAHIVQSPVTSEFKGASTLKEIVLLPVTLPAKAVGEVASFSLHSLNRLQFTVSKVVGNTMGLVRWRSGKMKNDAQIMQAMHDHLQPGDILLEKTPFTLTDKSIPGHFGHAAIYVGNEAQLRALGALELVEVKKNLESIRQGHAVVEALRNGVHLDTLQAFMNVDDVAILRPKYVSEDDRREAVNLALANLGKKYDFNFDVNTTETIVCSELVYIVYPQVDFVTKRVLNSYSISPDDIALQAGPEDEDPLDLILFGHDGHLVFDSRRDPEGMALYLKLVRGKNGKPHQAPDENRQAEPTVMGSR